MSCSCECSLFPPCHLGNSVARVGNGEGGGSRFTVRKKQFHNSRVLKKEFHVSSTLDFA